MASRIVLIMLAASLVLANMRIGAIAEYSGYEFITPGCINGAVLGEHPEATLCMCRELCDEQANCLAFEYVEDGGVSPLLPKCTLKSSIVYHDCTVAAGANTELFFKTQPSGLEGYTLMAESCIYGFNIASQTDLDLKECEAYCNADPACVSFEYSPETPYNSNPPIPARKCYKQNTKTINSCDGTHWTLDLYIQVDTLASRARLSHCWTTTSTSSSSTLSSTWSSSSLSSSSATSSSTLTASTTGTTSSLSSSSVMSSSSSSSSTSTWSSSSTTASETSGTSSSTRTSSSTSSRSSASSTTQTSTSSMSSTSSASSSMMSMSSSSSSTRTSTSSMSASFTTSSSAMFKSSSSSSTRTSTSSLSSSFVTSSSTTMPSSSPPASSTSSSPGPFETSAALTSSTLAASTATTTTSSGTTSASATTKTRPAATALAAAGPQEELAAEVGRTEGAVEEAARGVVALLTSAGVANASVDTGLGRLVAFYLERVEEVGESQTFEGDGGSEVVVPTAVLRSLPPGSALSILNIAAEKNDTSKEESDSVSNPLADIAKQQGKKLATGAVDISVYNSAGSRVVLQNLDPPLLFKIPGSDGTDADAVCAYLDTTSFSASWSTEGVWRAKPAELRSRGLDPLGVWCFTTHLSLFAALSQVLLGCTNLELFSEGGWRAVEENEGWHRSSPASILLFVSLAFCSAFLLAGLWELHCLRLGRTPAPAKEVKICNSFLTLGPQMLKHRYTVFLVYARDLLGCLRAGRHRLRSSSLTAGVQRFLALRTGIATGCVSQHCWNGGGWLESKASLPRAVLIRKLEFHGGMAEEVMRSDMCGAGSVFLALRRFLMTFLAIHPLLDAMRVGAGSMSTAKRTALQTCGCFGVLATNALIFNFSGSLRSWEAEAECPINPSSQLFLVVATVVSMAINVVPNSFLGSLAKQVFGRPLWTLFFWLLTSFYLLSAVVTVVLGLANLNPVDQAKWHASLRWSLTLKFVGMPSAQALRHFFLLEAFLFEDKKRKPCEQFPVVMGLRHPCEAALSSSEQATVDLMAEQSISAQELVKFSALLGEKLMPDFQPRASTSADVLARAIRPLCIQPPALEEYPIRVEVVKARGLKPGEGLVCSVLHLGKLAARERACLAEAASGAAVVGQDGTVPSWFATSLLRLEPGHALAFSLKEAATGRVVGMASLPAEQVLSAGQWQGELPLHPVQGGEPQGREASPVRSSGGCARQGLAAVAGHQHLAVRIELPQGYSQALAHHEVHKLKDQRPSHQSEVVDGPRELQEGLTQKFVADNFAAAPSSGGFCNRVLHERLPPNRMVVQSRQAPFLQTVATVVADALGHSVSLEKVERQLVERDFHAVLGTLEEAGCQDVRYWIEIFAVDPLKTAGDGSELWHQELMAGLPSLIRSLRRASCEKMVADIRAGMPSKHGPLKQLLVLDRSFSFMHEKTCLAEMMLGKAMRIRQHLVPHPLDFQDRSLAGELRQLAVSLGAAFNEEQAPWTVPYLEDRQAVYDTVKDLMIAAVTDDEKIEDKESSLRDLGLSDVAVVVGAAAMERAAPSQHLDRGSQGRLQGGDEDADDGGDVEDVEAAE